MKFIAMLGLCFLIGCGDGIQTLIFTAYKTADGQVVIGCSGGRMDSFRVGIVDGKIGCVIRSLENDPDLQNDYQFFSSEGFVLENEDISSFNRFTTVGEWLKDNYKDQPELMTGVDISKSQRMKDFIASLPPSPEPDGQEHSGIFECSVHECKELPADDSSESVVDY